MQQDCIDVHTGVRRVHNPLDVEAMYGHSSQYLNRKESQWLLQEIRKGKVKGNKEKNIGGAGRFAACYELYLNGHCQETLGKLDLGLLRELRERLWTLREKEHLVSSETSLS